MKVDKSVTDINRSRLTVITSSTGSDADVYLSPRTGLVLAQNLRNKGVKVLLVFDNISDYMMTEKKIFDLAYQPFGPTNILNEIRENTGNFKDKGTMSSIFIYDSGAMNFNFEIF